MSWKCPDCSRIFKHTNQQHGCEMLEFSSTFSGKNESVRILGEKILQIIQEFGEVFVTPKKSTVLFSSQFNFSVIKPKKNYLEIEFLLNVPFEEFPVYKIVKVSKNRFAHFVKIQFVEEIDEQLIKWLLQSYQLSK